MNYPDKNKDWLHITKHDGSERPCEFAAYVVPSKYAQENGSRPHWTYAHGIKFGIWFTGILGGKPTYFRYLERTNHDR